MSTRRDRRVAVAVVAALTTGMLAMSGPSTADVTAVKGSAYGYFSQITLFGGVQPPVGPTPTVTLPAGGSGGVPLTASQQTGLVQFGPAIVFSSGPITVSTQGTLGPGGSVASSASITTINTSGNEVFTATSASSSCTASEAGGATGSTTINGGVVEIAGAGGPTPTTVNVPTNPVANTSYNGVVANVNDSFRYVFNEQIPNADGSLTVNAGHLYLLGPTAVGDLVWGQSVCGITATSPTTSTSTTSTTLPTTSSTSTTTTSTTTTSTTSTTTTSTTTTSTSTTSTTRPTTTSTSTTSTTVAPTTTSTVPPTTSTTVASTTTTSTTRLTAPTLRPRKSIVCRYRGTRWGVRPPRYLICRR